MFNEGVMREIETVARSLRVEPAALAAVAHVESGSRTHAVVAGRHEPLIRFEGHYFDRRLSGEQKRRAREQGLASPKAGAVANPASQASRWALLARAEAIDPRAARESVSWGIGQVMGAHWAWLGHANVDGLVAEARSGTGGQLRLLARYIDKADLAGALRARDWKKFALGYNGPGYSRNRYDARLAEAYEKYRIGETLPLRRGDRGDSVLLMQQALSRHGFQIIADGIFGLKTEAALRRFQSDLGLEPDGIAGPATLQRLQAAARKPGFLDWIKRLLVPTATIPEPVSGAKTGT